MTTPTIGQHKILRNIGAGGMGVIFLAEDTQLRRKVALKVLNEDLFGNEEHRARFLREARSAAALNHPNIATVYQVGEVEHDIEVSFSGESPTRIRGGSLFLAMEFVEGKTLAEIIRDDGPMPGDELLSAARQIADGLAEAHSRGIIHRDLKPQNIMRGAGGRFKILDFGLAKSIQPVSSDELTQLADPDFIHLTQEGRILGTPAYMSPEQATGNEMGATTDIFSFGVILNDLATGQPPLRGRFPMWAVVKMADLKPEDLALARPDLPPALVLVRDRCLRDDPSNRFQDGSELRQALNAVALTGVQSAPLDIADIQHTLPLTAEQDSLAPVSQSALVRIRRAARLRKVLLLVSLFLSVTITGIIFAIVNGDRSPKDVPILAVLPFTGEVPENHAHLPRGIMEEVANRLAMLDGLDVISTSSTLAYEASNQRPSEISRELNVDYLMTGYVEWGEERDQVQVTPRLFTSGRDSFKPLSPVQVSTSEVFTLKRNIAELVAREIDHTLADRFKAYEQPPTRNPDAYEQYLLGLASRREYGETATIQAISHFERALAADSGFALAEAHLSMAGSWMVWAGYDLSKTRQELARASADRAQTLDPGLPETRLAMGYVHYYLDHDLETAREVFQQVLTSLPNNSDLLLALGAVYRRQGDFQESLEYLERAARLDPGSVAKAWEVGETHRFLREFGEAETWYRRAKAYAPADPSIHASLAEIQLLGRGDPLGAQSILRSMPPETPRTLDVILVEISSLIFQEQYKEALIRLAREDFEYQSTFWILRTWIHDLQSRREVTATYQARAAADSLRRILNRELTEFEDPNLHCFLGYAEAILGNAARAVQEGQEAVRLAGHPPDAILEAEMEFQLAWILRKTGDRNGALEILRNLLVKPSWVTLERLLVDPMFRDLGDELASSTPEIGS